MADRVSCLQEISIEIMKKINEDLISLSRGNIQQKGMATTLSGILFSKEQTCLFNIGNTRVYLIQSGKYLKQLTLDDTTLNFLIAIGKLNKEEISNFDRKNEITACFGGGTSDLFKIKMNYVNTNKAPIIIISDGIHDYLTIDQMEDIIDEFGLTEKTCNEMLKTARENNSCDDASIILCYCKDLI